MDSLIRSDDDATRSEDAARAKVEIVRRYRQICSDWAADQAAIDRHSESIRGCQAHQQHLAVQASDLEAAARAFGFNVVAEMAAIAQQARDQAQVPLNVPQAPSAPQPIPAAPAARGPTIKELVLELAQQAFPHPVRVSELRQQLANRGFAIHDKTVGMTLYRWLKAGRIRRDGWNWYFIGDAEEVATAPQQATNAEGSSSLFH